MERNIRIAVGFASGVTWIYCLPINITVLEFMSMAKNDGGEISKLRFL